MKIGYARVSTADQNLNLQTDALKEAGCQRIIKDEISGSVADRPGLHELLLVLRPGDTVVVWRLDRLGRSLKHLIDLVNQFKERGVSFVSLTESVNTESSSGQLIFHIFGAMAEFERNLIRERTNAGLLAARARGRKGGRPRKLPASQRQLIIDLYRSKKHSVDDICKTVGISPPTLYNYLRASLVII